MLTQDEANELLNMLKKISNTDSMFQFPKSGDYNRIELKSVDNKCQFLVDVNRQGKIKVSKCTYQNRYQKEEILLRLDINGPTHTNPDGVMIGSCHLHIYKEGYGDKWAYELPNEVCHTDDLMQTLIDFLIYCKVNNINEFQVQEVL